MDELYLLGDDEDDLDDEEIELLGELLGEEDPILGQRAALHRRIRGRRGGTRARRRLRRAMVPHTPGVPKAGARELPLPFPPIQFVQSGPQTLTMTARPQRPFKGRRLIITAVESAAGVGGAITVADLKCGAVSQPVATGNQPIATYGAGAFGVDLALDATTPGVQIDLIINITAVLGAGETVDVTAVLIGLAVA